MRRAPGWHGAVVAAAAGVLLGSAAAGAQAPADDPGLARQWGLARIGAPSAWSVATGAGITIAVVDSGVAVDHPDLADKVDAAADCVGHDDAPGGCVAGAAADEAGHGTHVAGIAAASTDNGRGVAGVAPQARILAVRVLADRCGPGGGGGGCEAEGSEHDVADGIRWAADNGADVINLSLGSIAQAVAGPGHTFTDALEHAWSRGAIPVLVAGNDLLLPGSLVDVPAVVVSATDRDDRKASYSNGVGNVRWGVAAPGGESDTAASCESSAPEGVLSTFVRSGAGEAHPGYACVAGTSMAAPHVAGALAVLRSAGLGPQEAVERLLATAVDLGPPGVDPTFGAGRVDLAAAVAGMPRTGQPVGSEAGTPPASTEVTASTASPRPEPEVAVPTTTPAIVDPVPTVPGVVPAPDAPPPAATAEPPPTGGDDQAADVGGSGPGTDGVPAGPVTAAVLLAVAVFAGHGWRQLRTANWARPTPRR